MANRVISIEIGKSITRAVEMDYKTKNPKVYTCFSFETPVGVLEDGMVRQDENFCNLLRGAIMHFGVRTKKVIFTVNSGRIASRDVQIPMVKENKISAMLMANSSEYFPVDLAQYQLVHRITETVNTKEDKYHKLTVLAVPNDLVKTYERLAEDCGLTIAAIDYVGNSIGQVMKKGVTEEDTVLIKVDESSSMITVMRQGKVDLQRNVAYGIEETVETMIETNVYGTDLSYADALQIMRRKTCIRRHIDVEEGYEEEEDVNDDIANARAEITESLRMLIGNIGRVLDYYISRNAEVDIRHVRLIGLGADLSGLSKLMTNELGIKVTPFQNFPGVNYGRITEEGGIKISEYVTAMGATFDPLGFQFTGSEARAEDEVSLATAGLVFGICALASVAMIGWCMVRSYMLSEEKDNLKGQVAQLQPAKKVYDNCNAAREELTQCITMYLLTSSPVDALRTFFTEIEEHIPSDLRFENFSTTAEGITMSVAAGTKESLSEFIIQLRECETIGTLSCSGLQHTIDEAGIPKVTATIVCTYSKSVSDEEVEKVTKMVLSGVVDEETAEKIASIVTSEENKKADGDDSDTGASETNEGTDEGADGDASDDQAAEAE